MQLFVIIISILFFIIQQASTESLLDRLYAAASSKPSRPSKHRYTTIYDGALDQQLILPHHSMYEVARFRGKPIMARQMNTIIDENGVAVPLLPFDGRKSSIANHIHLNS